MPGSNTAADHITVTRAALAQLPGGNPRPGKSVLIRADSAGGTHDFVTRLTGRRLSFSVGYVLPEDGLTADGKVRDGADVAEFTGILNLDGWPAGMRVIVRRERHRRRARSEDRIRNAKDTGLRNLPLHGSNQNRIWCAIVALAADLLAWSGLLAHPTSDARRWEPKRLRHRLYTIPAAIAHHARSILMHLTNRSDPAREALINARSRWLSLSKPLVGAGLDKLDQR